MRMLCVLVAALTASSSSDAFVLLPLLQQQQATTSLVLFAEASSSDTAETPRNPDRPELPELKGDFDWDEAYKGDDDWLTGDAVPGKMQLNEIELAAQVTELTKLEDAWRAERMNDEYEGDKKVGFVERAEILNGRFAMFFLVTGLLTEYWTGQSFPQQVEELLRISGVIGFDG